MSVPCTIQLIVMSVPCTIRLSVMSVPCTFNLFDSLSPVDLKALNQFENSSKVWKSVSKYISEQLTRTFAVLVFSDFEILNKKETYLSWPSFQVENDLEIEFLF